MSASILLLCLASQFCLVTGQLLTKHAMNATNLSPKPWAQIVGRLSLGIVVLTGWFFIWAGLLQKKDLSYVFPFEGLSPVLIVLGASVFLREKPMWKAWLGVALISLGIAVVAAS
ncbi:MAG TPA: EamA family transporter [Verrucomicrobiae bacterium]|nr:EamA family transporter [Verrucomicrobiae bacterium]